jgi:DNA-binding Xre family transcriptional regulator
MSSAFVFEALKMHLKSRGMTYADLAQALKISEATVKRIFATRNCTLERLDSICELIQVDLKTLARAAPREGRLLNHHTLDQEEELMADPAKFLVAVCAMQQMRLEEIVAAYEIDEARCVALLIQLERIGFLELHENNRIRLRVSRTFAWIPDGPIMRYVIAQTHDYFGDKFDGPGEFMRIVNVRVSAEARQALLARMEQLAREYSEQHNADSRLQFEERHSLSVCLAVRSWEPALFKSLRRKAAESAMNPLARE